MAKKSISEKKELNIRITFTEPLLGTISGDKDITEEFIASKHPQGVQEEELESIQELSEIVQKQSTYFARDKDKNPMLWDYQVKGFLKDACGMMLRITKVPELRAYKKIVDGLIFVFPRRIPLILPKGSKLDFIQRPLRGQTAQGERIALARSENTPEGTYIDVRIICLQPSLIKYVKNWLDYGALRGIGQWRNSGMGRFEWIERVKKELQ